MAMYIYIYVCTDTHRYTLYIYTHAYTYSKNAVFLGLVLVRLNAAVVLQNKSAEQLKTV